MIETFKPKKSKNFIVNLGDERVPPDLAKKISQAKTPTGKDKKDHYVISLIHPNTSEVIYEKVHKAKDLNEAFNIARDEAKKLERIFPTWYEDKKFIPAPKKGSTKLKTKSSAKEKKKVAKKKKTTRKKKKTKKKTAKKISRKKKTTKKAGKVAKTKKTRKRRQ